MTTNQAATRPVVPPDEHQEPPDYDSWYSAGVSFVFHFCLMVMLPLLQKVLEPRETLPPAVDVVQVAETTADSADGLAGLPGMGELPEATAESDVPEISPDDSSMEKISDIAEPETTDVTPDVQSLLEEAQNRRKTASEAVSRARAAAQAARDALNQNLGGSPGGGGGDAGGGGTGRAGRAARWVLRFNTSSARNYLSQLGGLGGEVAFPDRGDQYIYFSNLGGSPSRSTRNLDRENRIFWIDENPGSFGPVARELGVRSPPMMLAFLPEQLEQKMVKLELAYKGASSEDEIIQTVFECVGRAGGYDVIVVDQKLRR